MKRNFLLLLLIGIFSSPVLQAQLTKGRLFVGGSIFVTTSKANSELVNYDRKQINYGFSPTIGKFVKDNLVWGFDLNIGGYDTEYDFDDYQKAFTIGAGTFVRQYFPLVDRLYIFGEARFGVAYLREKGRNSVGWADSKGYNVGLSAHPGFSYAIKKNIYLETGFSNLATIYFQHKKIDQTTTTSFTSKTDDFHISSSISSGTDLSVGIRVII